MKKLRLLNIIFGWSVFALASFVYISTLEPSASLWDCGEFIAASYKLQVGHAPGAPLFLIIGRVFSLFAGENTELVAKMVNLVSAFASSFTILFLFWTISHLARKLVGSKDSYYLAEKIAIIGSALIGSLSYTFTDTFWFSAVEGEVYATSSLFTAIVFWAILKWENVADKKYSNRWIILIAYLIGLSIGIHLLNLLALPAIALIYYFRKYKVTFTGVLVTILVSAGLLGGIMYLIIPGFLKLATLFERIFVNGMGSPYWTGVIVFLILLSFLLVLGLYFTHQFRKPTLNTILLGVMLICLGYSSYATIIIRSNANPPMDQNNPENIFNLLSYVNREQYGERPLIYGQYFNSPVTPSDTKTPIFSPEKGRYEVVSYNQKAKYPKEYSTLFPRMWSSNPNHINAYLNWTRTDKGRYFHAYKNADSTEIINDQGQVVYNLQKPKERPDFKSNLVFFFRYQLNHMYFRYFMWNFSGRQNDIQSQYKEEITKGNWITGINLIDRQRLGPQNNLPRNYSENKARNKYYMIPLVLGLLGLIFQFERSKKDFWVVAALFFFTGIAVVLYLNQNPLQPRERDYAYAGSFYAFSIWIGLSLVALIKIGLEGLSNMAKKYHIATIFIISIIVIADILFNKSLVLTSSVILVAALFYIFCSIIYFIGRSTKSQLVVAIISFLLVLPSPLLLAIENWDDHNRSGRFFARNIAENYLNSCEENGILFTSGDNDTFPLWYLQEVEGVRTDVRVVNLSYLNASWYIQQMERQSYKSTPLPFSLTYEKYKNERRAIVHLVEIVNSAINLKDAIDFVAHDEEEYKTIPWTDKKVDFIPQNKFYLSANKENVFQNGTIKPNNKNKFTPEIDFKIPGGYIRKNHLMLLDLLATNDWERPMYFAITVPDDNYLGLSQYFEMAGLTYRIIPAEMKDDFYLYGGINSELMYDRLMNQFHYGNIGNPELFYDNSSFGMLLNLRNNFIISASKLVAEKKYQKANKLLDKAQELFPDEIFPYDMLTLSLAESYYLADNKEKSLEVIRKIHENVIIELEYYSTLTDRYKLLMNYDKKVSLHILNQASQMLNQFGENTMAISYAKELQNYAQLLSNQLK